MHDNGIFTWYTFAKEIFAEFEIDKKWFWSFQKSSVSVSVSIRRRYHLLVLTRREREHLLSVLESCFETLNCLCMHYLFKTELGRFPLDSFIKSQVMMYYSHIHSDKINPLIKEAFNLNKQYLWWIFSKQNLSPNDNVYD
jgi:hypothetical protein